MALALLIAGAWWSRADIADDPDIVSKSGLHWHPELEIYIKGEKQEIPENVGIGLQYASMPTYDPAMRMTAIHTHEDLPLIHLEFSGVVRRKDTELGNFFRIWGQNFSREMLLGMKNSEEGKVTMTVNGNPSTDFEHYLMKDSDKIVLRYE